MLAFAGCCCFHLIESAFRFGGSVGEGLRLTGGGSDTAPLNSLENGFVEVGGADVGEATTGRFGLIRRPFDSKT